MNAALASGDLLLGKYRIERALGQGGMGGVFAARHVELGELYAIKVMLPNTRASQEAVERFLREARIAAKLESEHVARVFDVGRADDGTLFMVMEHLKGRDLKAYLAERGRLPCEEAITYVRQACEALAEAHEMGIVHRDIKPANLFLAQKRKKTTPHIKVVDFGVSKELQAEPGQDLTKSGTMLGSPLYMSPEQMVYTRKVDARTDIWSLGVVLYELVTGVVPFPGETLTQVVHGVMSLEPAPVQALVADLPVGLDVVIKRCLQKEPEQRYGSVEELSAALGKVLNNEPVADLVAGEGLADTVRVGASDGGVAYELEVTDVGSSNSFVHKPLPRVRDSRNIGGEFDPETEPRVRDSRKIEPREHPTAPTLRNAPALASNASPSPRRNAAHVVIVVAGAIAAVSMIALGIREPHRASSLASAQPLPTTVPNPPPVMVIASNEPVAPLTSSSEAAAPLPAKVPTSVVRSSPAKPPASENAPALTPPPLPSMEPTGTRRKRTLL